MTTLTFGVNTIMAYVGADTGVVGVSGLTGMPVWGGSQVFFLQTSVSGPGIRQFNIDPDGSETLQQTLATLGLSVISTSSGGAACVTPDGRTIQFISATGNSVQLAEILASNLTLIGTFGTAGGSTSPSTSTRILAMDRMVATASHLTCGSVSSTQEVDTVQLTGAGTPGPNTNDGDLSGGHAFGIQLGPASGSLDAYLLALPFGNGVAPTTSSLTLYSLSNTGVLTSLGTFAPSDVDATWTHFFYIAGLAYDASDGNLIMGAQTTDSVSNKQYILKINASTGAVVWTRAITNLTPYAWSFTFSRVNGTYHYLDGSSLARHISTADGSETTETVTGLSVSGPQFSDDTTNSIILFGSFNPGAGPPQYVGSYMGSPGNHHTVTGWIRFWFITPVAAISIAEAGAAADTVSSNIVAGSSVAEAGAAADTISASGPTRQTIVESDPITDSYTATLITPPTWMAIGERRETLFPN
jgi:hypothetical protein